MDAVNSFRDSPAGTLRLNVPTVVARMILPPLLEAFLRRHPGSGSLTAVAGKIVGIVVLGVGLIVAVGQLEQFLGVDAFDQESVQVTLDEVTARTGQGGSYVGGTHTDLSPSRFPKAFLNVMFRPFPWQATNLQALVAAAEAFLLVVLFVTGWRRLLGAARATLDGGVDGREALENDLSRALRAAVPVLPAGADLTELEQASNRVGLARSFHNAAVRDTRVVRLRRIPRALHLAGRRELPQYFEIDDTTVPH